MSGVGNVHQPRRERRSGVCSFEAAAKRWFVARFPKSAGGAKEPQPSAPAVGIRQSADRAPAGRSTAERSKEIAVGRGGECNEHTRPAVPPPT